jgi:NitT/TauT family transport system permease protein
VIGGPVGVAAEDVTLAILAEAGVANSVRILFEVTMPEIGPSAALGLRIAIGLGWFSLVAAEMLEAQGGLGYGVQVASLHLQIERLYAYILLIGAFGYLFDLLYSRALRWALPWNELCRILGDEVDQAAL